MCLLLLGNNVLFAFSTLIHDAASRITHFNTLLNYSACISTPNLADFHTYYMIEFAAWNTMNPKLGRTC